MRAITTSWDDGFKESLQIGELLKDYRLTGTFFVPVNAVKGKEVHELKRRGLFLNKKELRMLGKDFEVGAHGVTHRYLLSLSSEELKNEIEDSKKSLENITGEKVRGFAYPGGKYNQRVVDKVRTAGFTYARTVEDGRLNPSDRFRLPISVFCTNTLIGRGKFTLLAPFSKVYAFGGNWERCILKAYRNLKKHGGVLHVAGHPQNLSNAGFRRKLQRALSKISGDPEIEYLTNREVVERLREEGRLE